MYMVSRPYVRSSSLSCICCSCLNVQYFTTACGILKIIQLVLGSICQSIMLFYGTKYMPTFGTSYESFLTTVAGCLMTTSVISVSYLLSKNTEVLVRSTLFEIMFGIFASICYFSSSSLLTMAVYMLLFPIFMTVPFTSLFSSIVLAYTIGFILSALYALDAYWAFKYYKGFP